MPVITEFGYLDLPYLTLPYGTGTITHSNPSQVQRRIDTTLAVHQQVFRIVGSQPPTYEQIKRQITNYPVSNKQQVKRQSATLDPTYEQANRQIVGNTLASHQSIRRCGKHIHEQCNGYQIQDYLQTAYLGEGFCVHVRSQVNRISGFTMRSQINRILYNTYNLRILSEFPSRGASGTNWTATATEAGDFNVYNLNTDIVEQIWRTPPAITSATLTCDTEVSQGVFLDTLGILNHNLTTSATLTMQSSNDATFTTGVITTSLEVTRDNIYYVTPVAPTSKYRYWRFQIVDGTNPAGFISIGTIVFGSAVIMQGECYVDELIRGTKHFSDKVATEGFTNVANNRAVKYSVGIDFRLLKYSAGNYTRIRQVFDRARTSLKCLWIPTPVLASRFAVFGKLESIPNETHKVMEFLSDKDYISFSVQVDESL